MTLEATLKSVGEGNEGVCCAIVEMTHDAKTQTATVDFRGDINTLYDGICSELGCPSVEIVYFDEEGDKIYLGKSQEELAEAIRCLLPMEMPVQKKEEDKKPDSDSDLVDALKEKLLLEEEQEQLQREKEQQQLQREKQQELQREKRAKQRENLVKRKEHLEQRIGDLDKKIGQLQEKKKELKEAQGDVHFKLTNLDNEDEIEQLSPPQQRERRLQQFRLEQERLTQRLQEPQPSAENENRMRERLNLITEKIAHLEAVQTKTKQTRLEGLKKQHANVSQKLETTPQNKPGQQTRLKERLDSISAQLSELEKENLAGPVSAPSAPMEKKEGAEKEKQQARKEEQQARKEKQQAQKEEQQARKEEQQARKGNQQAQRKKQQVQMEKQQAQREKQQAKQQAQREKQQAQKEKQQAQKVATLTRLQQQQTRLEARVQFFAQKQNKNAKQIETEKAVQQRLEIVQTKLQLINLQGADN